MKRLHLIIKGYVQGVGFRQFVKRQAEKLHIVGYVRNMPDNSVEAEFVGEEQSLQKILQQCKKGPFLSEVKEVKENWLDVSQGEDYTQFTIRHDF